MLTRRLWLMTMAGLTLVGLGPARGEERKAVNWADQKLEAIEGGPLDPAILTGKVVLVVNTASFCGFTKQYAGLEKLWETYRDRGFVVLGIPSNDFGGQEPGAEDKIKEFCDANFGIDFPMTTKQVVSGDKAMPLYKWAAEQTGPLGVPRWNFHKLLIARDGRLVDWFSTVTDPNSDKVIRAIEQALG